MAIHNNWQSIVSTNLSSARYDPDAKVCEVKFKGGGHYAYEGVAPEDWAAFEATFHTEESSTAFFRNNIKSLNTTRLN